MAKHTPGEWKLDISKTSNWIYDIRANKKQICQLNNYIMEVEANARLIAAAPELLEACKRIVDARKRGDIDITEWSLIEQAIAKAEGK